MKNLRESAIVQTYLEAATRGIKDLKQKEDIQDELFGHIEASVLQNQTFGRLNFEIALLKSLEELGPPKDLSESFFKVYNRRWAFVLKLSGGVALATLLGGLFYIYSNLQEARQAQHQQVALVKSYVDTYTQDLVSLNDYPIFKNTGHENQDAGKILNTRLIWMVEPEKLVSRKEPLTQPKIFSSMASSYTRRTFDTGDMERREVESTKNLDLTWMGSLEKYDYWDLYKYGPFSDLSAQESRAWSTDPALAPLPDLHQFVDMAYVRLVRGNQDPVKAITEVLHLVRLLISTESLIAANTAMEILKDTNHYAFEMVKKGKLSPLDFPGPNLIWVQEASKSFKAARTMWSYNVLRDPEIFKKVFAGDELPIGSCGAYLDSVNIAQVKDDSFLGGLFAGSADESYRDHLAQLRPKLEKECRLTYFKKDLSLKDWFKVENESRGDKGFFAQAVLYIPLVREVFIRYQASLDNPTKPREYSLKDSLYSGVPKKKAPQLEEH